ncbi:alpha/beta hydrolase [Caldimonas thermodepolymerans]|jgi:Predicted hydrolases or acyltransferases (alpha/beta hydrolase superfamily)|uniref:Alpha/beta hydrolase n=1 Tax=Caldimonas thermodepolymerans TaxID=215580 RepID=A0A2S5T4H1_9BURK|nr:alpha/beta hydrolase [Caldimonas thermodepolymerans]PPE69895.1 alpha/beta hydrolase [Caldimonas thermodepolymerans]QPC31625.1 alpha/beta hydrolase [Caldimonas thermodepolymerans]RDH94784.1 pimeloyl-ACP methyl ester carboxylesterase [Caldimonas thermodepolymerans]UZG44373.1 alpha/beta hydrolase [Caldimonas thermodepolymerans]
MPYITARDGVRLYYEEAGSGTPIVFVHEFGGDSRSWEPQMRYFTRRYRCITYAARGYLPSDVPEDVERYSQQIAVDDIADVMDGLGIDSAHVVGLSMGGFATLHFGLRYAARARSLVVAGAGYGAEKQYEEYFRNVSLEVARKFEELGAPEFSKTYAQAASRIIFQVKDPRGWQEFADMLAEHSSIGSARTMQGVQARRPSIYDLEAELRRMQVPTLVIVGDEDDHCLQPGIFLKKTVPASGLLVLPKAGHTINLEEPALFNQFVGDFLATVEQGKWLPRDPRSQPAEIMKTS